MRRARAAVAATGAWALAWRSSADGAWGDTGRPESPGSRARALDANTEPLRPFWEACGPPDPRRGVRGAGQHPHNEVEGNSILFFIKWPVQAGLWPFVYCRQL